VTVGLTEASALNRLTSEQAKVSEAGLNFWTSSYVLMMLIVGCASRQPAKVAEPTPAPTAPISNTDPCAMQMHDIEGLLLLHYSAHQKFPENIETLRQVAGPAKVQEFSCPVSHQPYAYDAEGVPGPDGSSRVIFYDASPAHAGLRWGIAVAESQTGGPIVAKVIALPPSWNPAAK
jgi:hypothetical protein